MDVWLHSHRSDTDSAFCGVTTARFSFLNLTASSFFFWKYKEKTFLKFTFFYFNSSNDLAEDCFRKNLFQIYIRWWENSVKMIYYYKKILRKSVWTLLAAICILFESIMHFRRLKVSFSVRKVLQFALFV